MGKNDDTDKPAFSESNSNIMEIDGIDDEFILDVSNSDNIVLEVE